MCVAGTGRSGGRGGFAPLGHGPLVVQCEDGFLQTRGAELEFGHRESIQVKPVRIYLVDGMCIEIAARVRRGSWERESWVASWLAGWQADWLGAQ